MRNSKRDGRSTVSLDDVASGELEALVGELDPSQTYRVRIEPACRRGRLAAELRAALSSSPAPIEFMGKTEDEVLAEIDREIQAMRRESSPRIGNDP